MTWVVLGEENGRIKLVSKKGTPAILPKGSYLTVYNNGNKYILRVDDSRQLEPYSPSPMIIDMDLSPIIEDRKCQNILYAYRIKDIPERNDGYIDYLLPQSEARRSNQEEINLALGNTKDGPKVFLATVHASQNQLLIDEDKSFITTVLPNDMFYHQMLICGKTGSGKTVATKYLAQYFVEELEGAVLAINVKDVDFLKMDKKTDTQNQQMKSEWEKEWKVLGKSAKGLTNFYVYYPANTAIDPYSGVNTNICTKITLDVKNIEPESLTGLLQGISDMVGFN
jgi:uncharacterized protein YqfB (UPF0267 family)